MSRSTEVAPNLQGVSHLADAVRRRHHGIGGLTVVRDKDRAVDVDRPVLSPLLPDVVLRNSPQTWTPETKRTFLSAFPLFVSSLALQGLPPATKRNNAASAVLRSSRSLRLAYAYSSKPQTVPRLTLTSSLIRVLPVRSWALRWPFGMIFPTMRL